MINDKLTDKELTGWFSEWDNCNKDKKRFHFFFKIMNAVNQILISIFF